MKIDFSFLNKPLYNLYNWFPKYEQSPIDDGDVNYLDSEETGTIEVRFVNDNTNSYYNEEYFDEITPNAIAELKKMRFKVDKMGQFDSPTLTCIPSGCEITVKDIYRQDGFDRYPLRAEIEVKLPKPINMRRRKYSRIKLAVRIEDLAQVEWSETKLKPEKQKGFQYNRFGDIK